MFIGYYLQYDQKGVKKRYGGEFNGHEFQELLVQYQIKDVPTTSKNSQANAICEECTKQWEIYSGHYFIQILLEQLLMQLTLLTKHWARQCM